MSLQRKAHPFCLLPRLAAILAGLFLAESPGQQAREEKLAGRDESTRGSWCMSARVLLSVLALQIWVPRSKQPKRRRVFLKDSRSESTLRVQKSESAAPNLTCCLGMGQLGITSWRAMLPAASSLC